MSMIGNYLRVSSQELSAYLDDSSKLEERIYEDNQTSDNALLDVDKSWEGLFYLLTGKSLAESETATSPLSWILLGPQVIDEEQDLGYGPASYTNVEQTSSVSSALEGIAINILKDAYNGKLMNELGIYPEIWEDNDSFDYLVENYNALKEFYAKAARENQVVIVFLN